MAETPKPSDIQNVLALNKPQHMLSKLLWEIFHMTNSMSVHEDNGQSPEPIIWAFNCAVTAWHITDWLWQSDTETRAICPTGSTWAIKRDRRLHAAVDLSAFRKQSGKTAERCMSVARSRTVRNICAKINPIPMLKQPPGGTK